MNDLTFEGVTQSVREWALDYGIPANMIANRIRLGWTVARAITTPMRAKPGDQLDDVVPRRCAIFTHNGASRSLSEWSHVTGLSRGVLAYRINNGWTLKSAFETPLMTHSTLRPKQERR